MFNDVDPDVDVQRLMHEIRASVAKQHRASAPENLPLAGPNNGKVNTNGHFHVNDLLQFHGEDFLQNAYRVLLGREIDEAGRSHYVEALSSGRFNKIDVLASLQRSPEGRSKRVQLAGLSLPAAVRRLGRLPVIGYFIRLLVALLRLPRLIQHQNQVEFHSWSRQQRFADELDRQHKELNYALQQISAQFLELNQRITEQQQANELALQQYQPLAAKQRELESVVEVRLDETRKYMDQTMQILTEHTAQRLQELHNQQQNFAQQAALSRQEQVEAQRLLNQQWEQQRNELAEQLNEQIQSLLVRQHKADVDLLMHERRLTVLLDQVRRRAAMIPNPTLVEVAAEEEGHLFDALYASFENQFRGTQEEVRRRLDVYVPTLKEARIADGVLDVGCGRGEWLQLMRSEGIEAQGVDRNRIFIEECRRADLNVVEEDALVHLRSLQAESLNVVTSFHLVEHLPFETLIKLIDEIARVLKPGGILIVETPNPENFMVGSCNFYTDPTHRNPIPSQTLQFLIEARGLGATEVLKLRPWDEARIPGDSEIVKRFNEYFYSAPDYGIIARKP